jgi:hypothetical protein
MPRPTSKAIANNGSDAGKGTGETDTLKFEMVPVKWERV